MFEDFIEFLKAIGYLFTKQKPKKDNEVEEKQKIEEIRRELEEESEAYGEVKSEYPNNFIKYPYNILKPDTVMIDGDEYTRYRAKFNSLYDLYQYLKSDPQPNRKVFNPLHSVMKKREFAGISYKNAVEELVKSPRAEYRDFLQLTDKLNTDSLGYVQEYEEIRTAGGGSLDIPAYVTGSPLCYRSRRTIYVPKFLNVDIGLSYHCDTTKKQVFNRALIIAALVSAFEQSGYMVGVNTFEIATVRHEIAQIDVNIKNTDDTFNKASLYKSLCYVEFLRRLLFRVLETLDVEENWGSNYGYTCSESFIRKAKRLDDNDIFFDQPTEMGIEGKDITDDFDAVLAHLSLEDKIDVEKAKKEFRKDISILKRTIK